MRSHTDPMKKESRGRLREQVVAEDVKKGSHSVTPRNLFPFQVSSARVGNRNFEDPRICMRELGGYLGLKAEPLGLQRQRPGQLSSHGFIAALHVSEVQIAEHVAERGKEPVSHRVPVVEDPVRAAEKPRPENRIGASLNQWLEERRPIGRAVLEIGVLNDDDVSVTCGDCRPDGRAFPAILLLKDGLLNHSIGEKSLQDVTRAVGRAIVNADDFRRVRSRPYALHYLCNGVDFVINGNEHRDEHPRFLERSYGSWQRISFPVRDYQEVLTQFLSRTGSYAMWKRSRAKAPISVEKKPRRYRNGGARIYSRGDWI